MEDLVSVPLEKVKECGDQRALPIVRAPQTFALRTHSANTPERSSGWSGMPPSAALHISSTFSETRSRWQAAPCLDGRSPPFAHVFHSLALMPTFSKVIFYS